MGHAQELYETEGTIDFSSDVVVEIVLLDSAAAWQREALTSLAKKLAPGITLLPKSPSYSFVPPEYGPRAAVISKIRNEVELTTKMLLLLMEIVNGKDGE